MGVHMTRYLACLLSVLTVIAVLLFAAGGSVDAQDDNPEATIAALETQVAEQRATSQARGERINAQKTRIAELNDQIDELESQLPPTPTRAPELTGKDKYPYVGDPLEVFTRPHNFIGHN